MIDKMSSLNQINNVTGVGGLHEGKKTSVGQNTPGASFDELLKGQLEKSAKAEASALANSQVKFSQHALDRIRSRGINMGADVVSRLNDAINKAADKGAKESLVLLDDSALIVSVKNKTVITAMDKTAMKENVFTNIDSTIIL